MSLFNATSRVAFAGMLHDLGVFAQKADIAKDNNSYTVAAAEKISELSPLKKEPDTAPFASSGNGNNDEFIEALSAHEAPKSFLQHLINEAARISIGINREDYEQSGAANLNGKGDLLESLFEEIRLESSEAQKYQYAYAPGPLNCANLIPKNKNELKDLPIKKACASLWQGFVNALSSKIPKSHLKNWRLWLDHFDSALLNYTALVPFVSSVGARADVPLYDHLKTTAAVAASLWRYHHENGTETVESLISDESLNENKFLLIQGDFFGIQDFIFSEGSQTNKNGAKLLRGRSFYVSLVTELAALKVLEALELPSTSQINNAAGKFMILAPNTKSVIEKLKAVRTELSQWFLENTYGKSNIGVVWTEAKPADFLNKNLEKLISRLFEDLGKIKYRSFDLCNLKDPVLKADFSKGPCDYNGFIPADRDDGNVKSCAMSRDQILIGESLVNGRTRILVENSDFEDSDKVKSCNLPVFGYYFGFASDDADKEENKKESSSLIRYWDFSLPKSETSPFFNGIARRNINCYIPFVTKEDLEHEKDKYSAAEPDELREHAIKTLHLLACENRHPKDSEQDKWIGQKAIMSLKGDVDNLGITFKKGLIDSDDKHVDEQNRRHASFAKTCGLSRMINTFFACYLPVLCAASYKNTYTIYAGGDDFFMLGPWKDMQELALEMKKRFEDYTAFNPEVHFSAGLVMLKPSIPLSTIALFSEEALDRAKQIDAGKKVAIKDGKSAVCLYDRVVKWTKLDKVLRPVQDTITDNQQAWGISQGFLYSLFSIIELADKSKKDPKASIWRSRLHYKVARIMQDLYRGEEKAETRKRETQEVIQSLLSAIENCGGDLRIPLSNIFYDIRED